MTQRTLRLATALLFFFAACAAGADDAPPLQPSELAALLAQPNAPLLLDVRTPEEFAAGHIPGALSVPVQELEARLEQLAPFKTRGVVSYCERGPRASHANEILRAAGFTNVRVLDGSMKRWREEGREIAKP